MAAERRRSSGSKMMALQGVVVAAAREAVDAVVREILSSQLAAHKFEMTGMMARIEAVSIPPCGAAAAAAAAGCTAVSAWSRP